MTQIRHAVSARFLIHSFRHVAGLEGESSINATFMYPDYVKRYT